MLEKHISSIICDACLLKAWELNSGELGPKLFKTLEYNGLSYGSVEQILAEALSGSKVDAEPGQRIEKLDQICDHLHPPIIALVSADNDYGGHGENYEQTPLPSYSTDLAETFSKLGRFKTIDKTVVSTN